ncbi:MAG: helix-turn-helix transcriptional regulator [Anaerococcus vaginalis]|nr:helix-turn-helix transcriptional regulator [Anaerococcus vaginalis]
MKVNINEFNIRLRMAQKNLNNKQLAEKMSVSKEWVSVVLGRGYATPSFINKLAKALDCEISEIVNLED